MISFIIQVVAIVKKPLLPQMVHDDMTRIIISIFGLIIISLILYKIAKYYGN